MFGNNPPSNRESTGYTIRFMIVLSCVSAIILALLATLLREPQTIAKETDRNQQMLLAARIISPEGTFQVDHQGVFEPANADRHGILNRTTSPEPASRDAIMAVYRRRITPLLVNSKGQLLSFEQAGIDPETYIEQHQKTGYERLPYKLIYKIHSPANGQTPTDEGFVIPIHGMGLWDAIYGYLAVEPDGNTVRGISWYDQKETPGLGANIAEYEWQQQFQGKQLFLRDAKGNIDLQTAPLGITVIKGKVQELYGKTPKGDTSVDGMAGATLTGNGVTNAYHDVLAHYRPFLISLYEKAHATK